MRLLVSTVVAVVVLALWLPVTADFDYEVTIAKQALQRKSYNSLLLASCAVAYSVAGLFRFGFKQAGVHTAAQKHDKLRPGRPRAAPTAKGHGGRWHPKTNNALNARQQHARTAPCRAGVAARHSLLAAASCHAAAAAGALAQAAVKAGVTGTAGCAANACSFSTESRKSIDHREAISSVSLSAATAAAAVVQGDDEDKDEALLVPIERHEVPADDASGGGFTVVSCWKRRSRHGNHGEEAPVRAAPAAIDTTNELQPLGRLVCIEEQLPGLARTLEFVPGEGNCQFCSVCMLLEGSWENHLQLRQRVCNHMAANEALFAPFVPSASLHSYLNDMTQPCSWGDELTLTAMADLLQRELRVVTDHHEGQQGMHTYAPLAGPSIEEPLYMWFRHGHYNPLLPQQ